MEYNHFDGTAITDLIHQLASLVSQNYDVTTFSLFLYHQSSLLYKTFYLVAILSLNIYDFVR